MLTTPVHALMAAGLWSDMRGANLLDSDASFYETYETAGARHAAVGCLEPLFFAEFARLLPLWPQMSAAIVDRVGQKTRDDWDRLFAATDSCVAPVLSLREAREHPHNRARNAFVTSGPL